MIKRISDRIKIARKEKKMSQELVAQHLKMSQANYSKIENGTATITLQQIIAICDFLDIDIKTIFNA